MGAVGVGAGESLDSAAAKVWKGNLIASRAIFDSTFATSTMRLCSIRMLE